MAVAKQAVARAGSRRWSTERVAIFFATLARTANVLASERAAGMGERSSYSRRARDPEFRAAWDEALREGYAQLEIAMLERATNGQRRPVIHGGKIVTEVTEYSDRLALTLLAAHRAAVKGSGAAAPAADREAIRRRIEAKIEAIGRRPEDDGGGHD